MLYDDGELVISGKGEIRDYFTGGAISSFSSNELIKIVTIEEGVTGIGEAVFYNCMNLEKVNISDTVKKIGDEAFSDCTSLKEVTIPDSVYTIGGGAFGNCTSLEKITLSKNLLRIEIFTFSGCSSLSEIAIPDTVTKIGSNAFMNCTSLKSIEIPGGVTRINTETFMGCKSLESITIPTSVFDTDGGCFEGCDNLKDIYYQGTKEKWNSSELRDLDYYLKATIHLFDGKDPVKVTAASLTKNGEKTYGCTCGNVHPEHTEKIYSPHYFYLSSTYYYYNGKNKTPTITVKTSSNEKLIEGVDFTVQYPSNRKEIGNHTIKVKFKGNYKGTKKVTFEIVPGKVTNMKAEPSYDSAKVSWDKVKGATGYGIYMLNMTTYKYEKIASTTKTSYTIKNLKGATTYSYSIKAYTKTDNGNIWSKASASQGFFTKAEAPDVKIKVSSGTVTLSWERPEGSIKGYQVYMKAPGGSYKKLATTTKTTYKVKDLDKGTYYFRVRAYSKNVNTNVYGEYNTYKIKIK